jgi:hypothetical protein
MVCSMFFCYSINTNLPFKAHNLNLWVGGSLFFFKKTNSQVTVIPLRGENNIHVLRGFSVFFFNSKNTNLTLDFEKQLRLHARFFLSSSYGFVINLKWGKGNWVCVCVCVCIIKNYWRVLVGTTRAFWKARAAPKRHRMSSSRAAFDAPHHSHHGGEGYVQRRYMEELWPEVFPSLPLSPLSF